MSTGDNIVGIEGGQHSKKQAIKLDMCKKGTMNCKNQMVDLMGYYTHWVDRLVIVKLNVFVNELHYKYHG